MGLVNVIRQASGKPWPVQAPDPSPARDDWLTPQIEQYRQGPFPVTEPTRIGLPSDHRQCKACLVSWVGPEDCWSCNPGRALSPFAEEVPCLPLPR